MADDALAPYVARISSYDIDCVEYVGPGLTRERILGTRVISMWSNDIKCKYIFIFPLQNLARKALTHCCLVALHGITDPCQHCSSQWLDV